MRSDTRLPRARRLAVPGAVSLILALLWPQAASAEAAVVSFNVGGRGALMHFYFSAPEAVLPFTAEGGVFESYGKIESFPHAFGYAGAAPVPLATSLGIVLPEGIPENVREGIRSVDYKALPNYCQADFPESADKSGEAYCGGPAQPEKAVGVTGALMNGHVKASGDFDDVAKTSILSEARIAELGFPGVQAKVFGGATSFRSFVNDEGIPVAEASARIESLSVLGSLVRFDQIESLANVVHDGTEKGSAGKVSLTIAQAVVAGIPVRVTSEGVTVSEPVQGMSPQQATESVNKALENAGGASIRILPGSGIQRDGNRLIAQSPSLVVEYNSKTPTPAHIVQEFGLAEINALAQGNRREMGLPLAGGETSSGSADSSDSSDSSTPNETGGSGDEQSGGSADSATLDSGDFGSVDHPSAASESSPDVASGVDTGAVEPPKDAAVDPAAGAVDLNTSLGDQDYLAEAAAANGPLVRPSPWVRVWYLFLAGFVPVAVAANAALKSTTRSLLRRTAPSA